MNHEEIKSVAITVTELLAEGLMVDLRTFLSLVMPNQYCLDITKVAFR